jgi:hypothetical protein
MLISASMLFLNTLRRELQKSLLKESEAPRQLHQTE